MIFKYLFILLIFMFLIWKIKNHVLIKYKTFIKRGFYKDSKPYGVYCYCGKQGKGKTYSVVEFLFENKDKRIYSNIKSIKGINYTYINGIEELLQLRGEKNCIIVFDEIFTILQKQSKMNTDILDFLSQMRKREMIFITTCQEWLELNITLRRYCRYQIDCNMISILGYPLLIKKMYDAEQMKWSQMDNEYIAPIVSTTISHGMRKVINSYDTYEQIGKFSFKGGNSDSILIDSEFTADTIADTTTISNRVVNGQFTQDTTQFDTDIKSSNDIIDKDFWNDFNTNDLTPIEEQNLDHLQ